MGHVYTTKDLGLETAVVRIRGSEEIVRCVCLGDGHAKFAEQLVELLEQEVQREERERHRCGD